MSILPSKMPSWGDIGKGAINLVTGGGYNAVNGFAKDGISGAIDNTLDFYSNPSGIFKTEELWGANGQDVADDYEKAVSNAEKESDKIWETDKGYLTSATTRADGTDRTIKSSLDAYDSTMNDLIAQAGNQANPTDRIDEFMNPNADWQNRQASQNVQGASGAALQSSATQNAIANQVANVASNNYNQAASTAINNANQNLSNIGSQASQAENVLTNDAMPQQDLMAMNQDWATNKLNTATQIANMQANTQQNYGGQGSNLLNKFF